MCSLHQRSTIVSAVKSKAFGALTTDFKCHLTSLSHSQLFLISDLSTIILFIDTVH